MSTSTNLWGDFKDFEPTRTPIAILKEQADALGKATNGILAGHLLVEKKDKPPNSPLMAVLQIIAPALNDYSVPVVRIISGFEPYPVNVISYQTGENFENIPDEKNFINRLKVILSSEQVKKVIASLISQSKGL